MEKEFTTASRIEIERDQILTALRSGTVPRSGIDKIRVGRTEEIRELLKDSDRISGGGASIRFLMGEFGSGKSFLLQLAREVAFGKKLIVAKGDLTDSRSLRTTTGSESSIYQVLMDSLSTKQRPDGGALGPILNDYFDACAEEATNEHVNPLVLIEQRVSPLKDFTGGHDYVKILMTYWQGYDSGDEAIKDAALEWLRGSIKTIRDARAQLGVRSIVNDASYFDVLKLHARLFRLAGYGGLLVQIDELTTVARLVNRESRAKNYDRILSFVNDINQGLVSGLGLQLAGTLETLTDPRRGLYSYPALQSRLAENTFAVNGRNDLSGPVIRLKPLTPDEILVLLLRIRGVFDTGRTGGSVVPEEAVTGFLLTESRRVGFLSHVTVRDLIIRFVGFLSIAERYPQDSWQDILVKAPTSGDDASPATNDTRRLGEMQDGDGFTRVEF